MNKKHLKILLGGSPCTNWSIAQRSHRETEASGIGWELFKNFLYARDKFKPDYFLYENNKSAAPPIKEQISRELGVDLQYIDSALVSAQKRSRFYAHNIQNVQQPADRGILLKDILSDGIPWQEKSYALTARYNGAIAWNTIERKQRTMVALPVRIGTIESGEKSFISDSQANRVYSPFGKSVTLNANGGGAGGKTGLYASPIDISQKKMLHNDKKYQIYEVKDSLIEIQGNLHPINLADGFYIIRKLNIDECRKLQTIPSWYIMPCSNAQNYKMLGNGWTIEVVKHILGCIPYIRDCTVEVLSMYSGINCDLITFAELGTKVVRCVDYEIDKYAIHTASTNFSFIEHRGDAFQLRNSNWRY